MRNARRYYATVSDTGPRVYKLKFLFLSGIIVNFRGCSAAPSRSSLGRSESRVTACRARSPRSFVNPQLETSREIPALHSLLRAGTQRRLLNVLSTEKRLFFLSLPLTTPPITSHLSSHIIYRTLCLSQLLS